MTIMKDKLKSGSGVFKGLIKTSGDVADKMLDKSAVVVTDMMKHMTGLISKLSDDIGLMANRILQMEERIGLMADRIVKTEAMMAQLTASLTNKDLNVLPDMSLSKRSPVTTLLEVTASEASWSRGPELKIAGNPYSYLLYISRDPLFQNGSTVVTRIDDTNAYEMAWQRSINALKEGAGHKQQNKTGALVISIAVKSIDEHGQVSALSNSIDVIVDDTHLAGNTAT